MAASVSRRGTDSAIRIHRKCRKYLGLGPPRLGGPPRGHCVFRPWRRCQRDHGFRGVLLSPTALDAHRRNGGSRQCDSNIQKLKQIANEYIRLEESARALDKFASLLLLLLRERPSECRR